MLNLRDLIYGTSQPSEPDIDTQDDQTGDGDVESDEEPQYRPLGPFYSSTPRIRRKHLPDVYWESPQVKYQHTAPFFLPGQMTYYRFGRREQAIPVTHRRMVRAAWEQALHGGDVKSAVQVLKVMLRIESVEYADFYKFVTVLRERHGVTVSEIGLIASTAIKLKLHPARRAATARAVLEMFVELLSATSSPTDGLLSQGAERAIDLLNRYLTTREMHGDGTLLALLGVLHVSRVVEAALIVDSISPSLPDVARNPFLYSRCVHTLQRYCALYSIRVGEDRRQEFRRVLQEAETHLTRAAKVEDNGHILDLMALYAAYMHIARDSTEADSLTTDMATMSDHGRHLRLLYLVTCRPDEDREVLEAARHALLHDSSKLVCPLRRALACVHLHRLGALTDAELVAVLCSCLESSPPSLKSGKVGKMQCGLGPLQHSLWKHLAHLLGPLSVTDNERPLSTASTAGKRISSDALMATLTPANRKRAFDALYGSNGSCSSGIRESLVMGSLRDDNINIDSFRAREYSLELSGVYAGEEISTAADDTCSPSDAGDTPPDGASHVASVSSHNPIDDAPSVDSNAKEEMATVAYIRESRSWWVSSGYIFSAPFIGDEFPWSVLSCTTEAMEKSAVARHTTRDRDQLDDCSRVNIWSAEVANMCGEGLEVGDGGPCSREGTQRTDGAANSESSSVEGEPSAELESTSIGERDLFLAFIHWCQEGFPLPPQHQTLLDQRPESLSAFAVRKRSYDLEGSSPHWRPWFKRRYTNLATLMRRVASMDKLLYLEAGKGLLETLCYQAVVCSHIAGDQDGVFQSRVAQLLVQHGEGNDDALRCVAYLRSMNFDVVRAVKVGNTLKAHGADVYIPPPQITPLPPNEVILTSSPLTASYQPL